MDERYAADRGQGRALLRADGDSRNRGADDHDGREEPDVVMAERQQREGMSAAIVSLAKRRATTPAPIPVSSQAMGRGACWECSTRRSARSSARSAIN